MANFESTVIFILACIICLENAAANQTDNCLKRPRLLTVKKKTKKLLAVRDSKGTNHLLQSCHKVEKKNISLCVNWCARLSGPPLYHPLSVLSSTCQMLWKRCSESSTGCDTLTAAAAITSFICNETMWANRVMKQPTNDSFFFPPETGMHKFTHKTTSIVETSTGQVFPDWKSDVAAIHTYIKLQCTLVCRAACIPK